MTLINMLRPPHRLWLRRLRKRLANREHMRRAREARKLCCVGVDLPLDAGTCGRMVHAESQRCIHCTKRRWWLIKHALNGAEVAVTAILENDTLQRASEDETLDNLPAVVPTLDDLSDLGDVSSRTVTRGASDVQASLPSSNRGHGPSLPYRSARRNVPSRHGAPLDSAPRPAGRQPHIERIVQRVDQLRVRVAFGQLDQLPQDTAHDETQRHRFIPRTPRRGATPSMSAPASTSGLAVRTRRRQRQPHVNGELRHTAHHLPRPIRRHPHRPARLAHVRFRAAQVEQDHESRHTAGCLRPPDLCRPLDGPPPRSVLDIVAHQPLAAHNIGSASSRNHSRAGDICRHAPILSCSTGRIRIASNGGHHGLARTIEVPRPDAAAEPPSGAPRLRLCRRGPSNGRRRATGSTSPSETTEPPQSGHLDGHGSRTSTTKRVRQPEHRPGRVSRRSGCVVGR